ncbi:hypothetical protein CTI12_AA269740 [Artemisia annua]|uniref:Uncharacterized protein n=1 Tax=Artemisia annua TaxID=35608 RepID=A0A2U1NCC0_ARTAN|nr:hypothetical protein CTI12_AA269740 [Artemisia annua]
MFETKKQLTAIMKVMQGSPELWSQLMSQMNSHTEVGSGSGAGVGEGGSGEAGSGSPSGSGEASSGSGTDDINVDDHSSDGEGQ